MSSRKNWSLMAFVLAAFGCLVATPAARADIISVQNTGQTCSSVSSNLAVNCTYNYSAINGATNPLVISGAAGSSGLYVIVNDTGSAIDSISFTWSGQMAQNQFMNCQFGGGESGTCMVTSNGGGSGSGTSTYDPCPGQSDCNPSQSGSFPIDVTGTFTWTGFAPVASGGKFDISFASWANGATQNNNQVPEPASILLLGAGLSSTAFCRRWRR